MAYSMKDLCERFNCQRHLLEHAMLRDEIKADFRTGRARMWNDSSLAKIQAAVDGSIMRRPYNWKRFRHGARREAAELG